MNILIRNLTNCRIFFRLINFNGKGTCKVPFPLKFRPLKFQCPTLLQREALTLYQHCAMLKIQRPVLFHFRRRINVISTLIHNVETKLIQRWNVGWVCFKLLEISKIYLKTVYQNRKIISRKIKSKEAKVELITMQVI